MINVQNLGITTYLFLFINFGLLILGVLRLVMAFAFTITSVFIFAHVRDITFTPLISETIFVGLNEIAMFILGLLGGFKSNIRLLYSFEFLILVLIVAKTLSIHESIKDRDIVNEDLQLNLEDMMNDFREDPENAGVKSNVAGIQNFFHCCGYESPNFYSNSAPLHKSCCPKNVKQCNLTSAWPHGCKNYVKVPSILFEIHYYTLYPVCEGILFLIGALLITFVKNTARHASSS